MRRGFWSTLALLLVLLALTGLALAQETTPEPIPPTLTETPTATPTPTDTASPEPVPSPLPTATETPLPTPSSLPTETAIPTVEATVEQTPPVEATIEVTAEVTEETTAEATNEMPMITPTASETPLPGEPVWQLISSSDFEQGTPPAFWRFDSGWGPLVQDGQRVFGPRSFGGSALFAQPPLLDTAVQLRVYLANGVASVGIRQSETGGYRVTFEEGGFLRLYRGEQEIGQAYLGPIAHQWRTLRLSAAGDVVRVFLDGAELIVFVDPAPLPPGFVTLGGGRSIGSRFLIDDLSVWAAEGQVPAAQPMAAAFAAPMPLGSVAGQITSVLAYTYYHERNQYEGTLALVHPDGTTTEHDSLLLASHRPWSPDGQRLLVKTASNDGISVFSPSNASLTPLTHLPKLNDGTGDDCPVWSPDGTQVAFLSTRRDGAIGDNGLTYFRTALYLVAADGQSAPVRIAVAGAGSLFGCPQWWPSDEGPQLIVLKTGGDQGSAGGSLVAIPVATGVEHTLYTSAALSATDVLLSPDGSRVAFSETECGCFNVVRVLDLQQGAVITVTPDLIYQHERWRWNHDGTALLISRVSMYTGIPEVVVADPTQPCVACNLEVVAGSEQMNFPEWSPDGAWIAGLAGQNLVLLPMGGGQVIPVTSEENGLLFAYALAWQPLPNCAAGGAMRVFSTGGLYCPPLTPTPDPLGPGCPAVINLRQDVPDIPLREAPNREGALITSLTDDTPVTLHGLNLTGGWAYIEWNETPGWISRDAVSYAACATYSILDDNATPMADAPYDFILDVTNIASFRATPCLASLPEDATDDERNANFRGCARVVLYYFSTQFSSESPMRMSDILSAVYSGELSTLIAATGSVPLGLNSFSSASADDIGREALINNFWAVAYELRRNCLEIEGCEFVLSPEEIADHYLYQVQSWYQNAIPFQQNEASGDLLDTYYTASRAYRGLAYEALLSADRTIEGRPWQWGNYGYGNENYATVQTNPATAYCYVYRAFVGNALDSVQYTKDTEFWTDYKFAIITIRSIGQTSTFDIQGGTNRPGWVDSVIMVPQANGVPIPIPYGQYLVNHNGRVYAPCDISASDTYPTRG